MVTRSLVAASKTSLLSRDTKWEYVSGTLCVSLALMGRDPLNSILSTRAYKYIRTGSMGTSIPVWVWGLLCNIVKWPGTWFMTLSNSGLWTGSNLLVNSSFWSTLMATFLFRPPDVGEWPSTSSPVDGVSDTIPYPCATAGPEGDDPVGVVSVSLHYYKYCISLKIHTQTLS